MSTNFRWQEALISADALDQLAEFAARGQLGYGLEFRCSDLNPEAESLVALHWDFHSSGWPNGVLQVGNDRFDVPPVGQRSVYVDGSPVRVQLSVEAETVYHVIHPRFTKPNVQLLLPRRCVLGEAIRLIWQSSAESCLLIVTDGELLRENGELLREMDVGPAGGLDVRAGNVGDLVVKITAYGRHARFSREGIARDEARVRVLAPPLTIELHPSNEQVAFIGDEVFFRWQVRGAQSVRLVAIDRGEAFDVSQDGQIVVDTDPETERFRLIATGFDGSEAVQEFRVLPQLMNLDGLPESVNELITKDWE